MAAIFKFLVDCVMSLEWTLYHQSVRVPCYMSSQMLLLSGIALASVQLTSYAVDCVADIEDLPASFLYWACYNQKLKVIDSGAGPAQVVNPKGYYTWASVYLMLLTFVAFAPLQYWLRWENNMENNVTRTLNDIEDISGPYVEVIERKTDVVRRVLEECKRANYARAMLFSRVVAYVAFEIVIRGTNYMVGGGFFHLGRDVLWHALGGATGAVSPLDAMFPTTGLCTLQLQTASGDTLVSTAVCKLEYSHMLRKVHLGLWLWLMVIRCIIFVCLVVNALAYHRLGRAALVRELFNFGDERDVQLVVERLDLGALLFLRQLRRRVMYPIYIGVLGNIAEDLLQHQD